MTLFFMKRIPLSHTMNTRDLGGYPARDGKMTSYARILRSDAPFVLSAEDAELLKQLNVTAAIDFRSKPEIERNPSAFELSPDFDYFHCPFAIGNRDPGSKDGVPALYGEIISDFPAIGRIMRIIAGQKGAVLIHCAVGKDRTGVVAALLLLAAGVGASDILADYQVSYTYIRHLIRETKKKNPELPDYYGRSDMENMEKTLIQFKEDYHTIDEYLEKLNLTTNEQITIKNKLF